MNTREAALASGKAPSTVRKWAKAGIIGRLQGRGPRMGISCAFLSEIERGSRRASLNLIKKPFMICIRR
jgi:hypothetical protein